jgi:hypothetical protein
MKTLAKSNTMIDLAASIAMNSQNVPTDVATAEDGKPCTMFTCDTSTQPATCRDVPVPCPPPEKKAQLNRLLFSLLLGDYCAKHKMSYLGNPAYSVGTVMDALESSGAVPFETLMVDFANMIAQATDMTGRG